MGDELEAAVLAASGGLTLLCSADSYKDMNVAARELKNRLGKYLRRVKLGQSVTVTDRGVPVAELKPIGARGLSAEQRLERMAEAGDLTRRTAKSFPSVKPVAVRGVPVAATLLRDRG